MNPILQAIIQAVFVVVAIGYIVFITYIVRKYGDQSSIGNLQRSKSSQQQPSRRGRRYFK